MGALFAVLKVLEGYYLNSENSNDEEEEVEVEENKIVAEIEKSRKTLEDRIPVIKIASSLFK